jgi:hypothetical protein
VRYWIEPDLPEGFRKILTETYEHIAERNPTAFRRIACFENDAIVGFQSTEERSGEDMLSEFVELLDAREITYVRSVTHTARGEVMIPLEQFRDEEPTTAESIFPEVLEAIRRTGKKGMLNETIRDELLSILDPRADTDKDLWQLMREHPDLLRFDPDNNRWYAR